MEEITIKYNEGDDDPEMRITDAGMMTLATSFATCLESVTLKYCENVTDDGLAVLAICHRLRCIEAEDCENITGSFLEQVTDSCRNLEKIACFGSEVNFRAIASRCPLLRDITLCHATDEKVKLLVQGCPLLTHLRLYGGEKKYGNAEQLPGVSDISLAAITAGLRNLELLATVRPRDYYSESKDGVTDAGLYKLLQNCPHITFLRTGVKISTGSRLHRMILQRKIIVAGLFNEYCRWER